MITRRNFLKSGVLAGTGVALGGASFVSACGSARNLPKEIIILHTNDQHSRIEPFPDSDPKNAGLGGFARRASLINKIRAEHENVLLFDSGDIIQGTPYFNMFGGNLEIELMNKMGYDAATIGNHEFDGGIENLATLIEKANFPFICSNYDFSANAVAGKTIPHKIFSFKDFKIGVFGLGIKLAGLVDPEQSAGTKFLDPIEVANEKAKYLKEVENCDYVIVLSHLGFDYKSKNMVSDKVLAEKSSHINLILGGHTHTFLEKPEVINNLNGQEVTINQVGWAGINLGFLSLDIQAKGPKLSEKSGVLTINQDELRK
jgi:5'-nucleotidase